MEEWFEILIFAVVIIANIFGAVIKAKKKKEAQELGLPPEASANEEYFDEEFPGEEYFETPKIEEIKISAPPQPAVRDIGKAPSAGVPQAVEAVENDKENDERFDYGEFIRTHGKEAFVLAEIILPANSRQGH